MAHANRRQDALHGRLKALPYVLGGLICFSILLVFFGSGMWRFIFLLLFVPLGIWMQVRSWRRMRVDRRDRRRRWRTAGSADRHDAQHPSGRGW